MLKDKKVQELLDKSYEECFPYLPPARLDISITTSCNTRCAYCWQQEKKGSLLSFDSVANIIDVLCLMKPPKLNLTGGEPTIWPDFERLVGYANKSGIKDILLCTNGRRLKDIDYLEKIISLGISAINISVDTFNKEKFEWLRGYDFTDFTKAISNCLMIKNKYPNVYITLASVMSKAVTPEELFEIKRFCISNKLGYFIQTFDHTGYYGINKEFGLNSEERKKYNQRLAWLEGKISRAVRRDDSPFTEGERGLRCLKGITTIKVLSDGSIRFCWNGKTIGNILRNSFIEIWNSKKALASRKFIRDRKCNCDFDCDIYESLELLYGA